MASRTVIFDAAQFLGELREGLPKLTVESLKGGLRTLKGAGSDYLNVQFGWIPFVSDVKNAVTALVKATGNFDSGWNRRVHRSYTGVPFRDSSHAALADQPISVRAGGFGNGDLSYTEIGLPRRSADFVVTKTAEVHRWFEGEFTSFLPLGFDPTNYLQKASQLINLELSPSVLWELTPWSWLVDWSLKIGDALDAAEATANDRLIMHYGYAMEKSVYTTTSSWSNLKSTGTGYTYSGLPSSMTTWRTDVFKRRARANPFGFKAVAPNQLNAGQFAILGALGLSQGIR